MTVTLVESRLETALRQHHHPAVRRLVIEDNGEVIVLCGRVPSYYLKQLAQEAVLPLLTEQRLINQVEVVRVQEKQ